VLAMGVVYGLMTGLVAAPAYAQQPGMITGRPERPNRELFGGGNGNMEQSLDVEAWVTRAVDWLSVPDSTDPVVAGRYPDHGVSSTNWSGDLAYALRRTRVTFDATGTLAGRYIPEYGNAQPVARLAQAGGRWQVARRTPIGGTLNLAYQPLSVTSLFSGLLGPDTYPLLPYDYAPGAVRYGHQDATVDVAQALTRRSTLSANFSYRRAQFTLDQQWQSYRSAGVTYTHQWGRGLSWYAGYITALGDYGLVVDPSGRQYRNRSVNLGVNVDRALSLTRHTKLSFRVGSVTVSDNLTSKFFMTGDVTLTHELGRTWNTNAIYSRQVSYIEGTRAPALSDVVSAGLDGLVSRRMHFRSSAAASRGTIGLSSSSSYSAYRVSVGLAVGLTRWLAVQGDYWFNQYRFDSPDVLVVPYANQLGHQSVQVGVALWAPLLQRARRPNAAR
jgi:hypothetical protein